MPSLRELVEARLELLATHRIDHDGAHEVLGSEARDLLELEVGARRHRVADLEDARVVDAHHVPGETLLDDAPLLREERGRVRQTRLLLRAHHLHLHAALEPPRAHAKERDAVAVRLVHVRLDLEHEGGERVAVGSDGAFARLTRQGRGHLLAEGVEERLEAEVVDGAPEEHRRDVAGLKARLVERVAGLVEELDFLLEPREALAELLLHLGIVEREHPGFGDLRPHRRAGRRPRRVEEVNLFGHL